MVAGKENYFIKRRRLRFRYPREISNSFSMVRHSTLLINSLKPNSSFFWLHVISYVNIRDAKELFVSRCPNRGTTTVDLQLYANVPDQWSAVWLWLKLHVSLQNSVPVIIKSGSSTDPRQLPNAASLSHLLWFEVRHYYRKNEQSCSHATDLWGNWVNVRLRYTLREWQWIGRRDHQPTNVEKQNKYALKRQRFVRTAQVNPECESKASCAIWG